MISFKTSNVYNKFLKFAFLITFISIKNYCFSQTIYKEYKYSILKPVALDSNFLKIKYNKEFIIHRDIISDTEYLEYGLIIRNDDLGYRFKKESTKWLVLSPNDTSWNLFFDLDSINSGKINIWGIDFICSWSKDTLSKQSIYYVLTIVPPEGTEFSHLPQFIFHKEEGIVGLIGQEYIYIRTDQLKYFK